MNVLYITGNAYKAKYFSKMVGLPIKNQKVATSEPQTLDLELIITQKAKEAYKIVRQPIIVEDTALWLHGMNGLPGPLVKWFIESVGVEGLCKLSDTFDPNKQRATAGAMIAYYDGDNLTIFRSQLDGQISKKPLGVSGFGFNRVFIPSGQPLTLGQMDDGMFEKYYKQVKPFTQLREFLLALAD